MKMLWKVLAWVFVICGVAAYIVGWIALFTQTTVLGMPTEFWFYDAIATGIFGIFFLMYGTDSKNNE